MSPQPVIKPLKTCCYQGLFAVESLIGNLLLGVVLEANGAFMLVSPENWYFAVPGVTSTGPFNQHFLRDIGMIFLFLGGAFLLGVERPDLRVLLWASSTCLLAWPSLAARRAGQLFPAPSTRYARV